MVLGVCLCMMKEKPAQHTLLIRDQQRWHCFLISQLKWNCSDELCLKLFMIFSSFSINHLMYLSSIVLLPFVRYWCILICIIIHPLAMLMLFCSGYWSQIRQPVSEEGWYSSVQKSWRAYWGGGWEAGHYCPGTE